MATPSVGSSTGLPIDKLISLPPSSTPAAKSSPSVLGEDDFLKLLTVQLKNQDPLKPMDETQSIAQLAQFSALQSQNELKNSFEAFQASFGITQTSSMIGKTVTVSATDASGNDTTLTGTLKAITVVKGQPLFSMTDRNGNLIVDQNGQTQLFSTKQILSVG